MKLSDIVRQVNRDIDDDYDLEDVRDWVNRCLDDLTPIAKKESLALTEVNFDNIYALPDDLYEVAFIRANNEPYSYISLNDELSMGIKFGKAPCICNLISIAETWNCTIIESLIM